MTDLLLNNNAITITILEARASTLYRIFVNQSAGSFTSDASPTINEITAGLTADLNNIGSIIATDGMDGSIRIVSKQNERVSFELEDSMADLMIVSRDHDLSFVGYDLELTSDRSQEMAQRVKITLLTFQGEWFLDTTFGCPWFQDILGRKSNLSEIDTILKSVILDVPGVDQIVEYESEFDISTRKYSVECKIKATTGDVAEIEVLI